MAEILELKETDFDNFISDKGVTVVDFWAVWCGPCRALAPEMEKVAEKLKNKAKFAKLNVDETPSVAVKYHVASIPNVCIFKSGELVDRSIGYTTADELEQLIEKHV